jgi:hypothetical protein
MNGLIIGVEPIEQILSGEKCWEMRGKFTHVRGRIALIKKGTKTIVGFADLIEVLGPLSLAQQRKHHRKHRPTPAEYANGQNYKETYAWVLTNIKRVAKPIPYQHPSGAVIWVKLDKIENEDRTK